MDNSPSSQKAILLPNLLIWLIGILAAIHIIRQFLPLQSDLVLLFHYGVTPYDFITGQREMQNALSLITHMFLHADLQHLLFNSVWLATFGTPVVRRLGVKGFLAIFLLGGLGGAALYIYQNPVSIAPMIGASGAISALIGAAVRFAFRPHQLAGSVHSQPVQSLTNRNVLIFTGLWFFTNWLMGSSSISSSLTGGQSIAWEAHIGGFVTGIILFPLIDRMRKPI